MLSGTVRAEVKGNEKNHSTMRQTHFFRNGLLVRVHGSTEESESCQPRDSNTEQLQNNRENFRRDTHFHLA